MFNWISKIFIGNSPNKFRKRGNLIIESDSESEADIISKCYKTGKTVSGSVDENGNINYDPTQFTAEGI